MTITQQLIDKGLEINADYIQILEYQSMVAHDYTLSRHLQPNHEGLKILQNINRSFYHIPSLIQIFTNDTAINKLFEQNKIINELIPEHAFVDPFTFRPTISIFKSNAVYNHNINVQNAIIKTRIIYNDKTEQGFNNTTTKNTNQNDLANLLAEIAHELFKIGIHILSFDVVDRGGDFESIGYYGTVTGLNTTIHKIQYIAEGVSGAYGKTVLCYHSVV